MTFSAHVLRPKLSRRPALRPRHGHAPGSRDHGGQGRAFFRHLVALVLGSRVATNARAASADAALVVDHHGADDDGGFDVARVEVADDPSSSGAALHRLGRR